MLGCRIKINSISTSELKIQRFFLLLISTLLTLLIIIFCLKFRNNFFSGYTQISNVAIKGSFVAATIVILGVYFISAKIKFLNKYLITLYFASSVMLLSMGGRLYFASGILALLIYKNSYEKKIKKKNILVFLFAFICLFGLVGIIRQGGGVTSQTTYKVLINIIQESFYTSLSLVSFLSLNDIPLIGNPIPFMSYLTNMLPSAFFPEKSKWIISELNYAKFSSPLGAQNSFVGYTVNFGIIGTAIFLFLLGFFLTNIKHTNKRALRAVYCLLASFLATTFFRDGLVTSLVKNIIQFSIITPILVVLIGNFFYISTHHRR